MYRKLAALTFSSFVLLAGCSDSSDDDSGTTDTADAANSADTTDVLPATNTADTTAVLLATADKSDVRVNGVRVYTNSVPTRISTFGSDGALIATSQITIDVAARTWSEVRESVNNVDEMGVPLQSTAVASFNEFGQLAVLEPRESEDENEIFTRYDFVYEGERITNMISTFFDETIDVVDSNFVVEDRFNFDDNGRVVGGSRFFQDELLREWTREYNDSGWVETGGEDDEQVTKEVTVNDDGLIERIVTTDDEFFVSTEIRTYDEQGRFIQVEEQSDSGELFVRIEYQDFEDTDVYWHDLANSVEAFSLFFD